MEEIRLCPECGTDVGTDLDTCPCCGYPLKSTNKSNINKIKFSSNISSNKRKIGIIMCAVAILFIIIGITRITNDDYKFYTEHLEECLDAYGEVKAEAKRSSGWFSSAYNSIADRYEDLIADDRKELWIYRIQAIVSCSAGAVLLYFGVPKVKQGGEDDGID